MRDFGYSEEGPQPSIGDRRLWLRVLEFSGPYKWGIGIAVIISLVITWSTLKLPQLLQTGIDDYITAAALPKDERFEGLLQIALYYGSLILVVFVATFTQIRLLEWVGQSVMHSVRQKLFRHILTLDLDFFGTNPVGRLVTRLTNDIQNMNEMFTSVIVTLFNDLLRLSGILILLFWMNPRLAGILSIFVPVALVITILFARLAREKFRAIRSQLAKLNSFLAEALSGIFILQLFDRESSSLSDYKKLSQGYVERTLGQIKLFGTFMPLTEFMSSAAIALILWYGGGEILRNRLSLGELVAFISYMRLFFQPLRELSQKYSVVQSAMASAERIFQLLDTDSIILDRSRSTLPSPCKGKLEFQEIRFGYTSHEPVIHDLTLTFKPGQTVALVGTTGSGKTTLVNLLLRFYEPQKGKILIDDIDIREISLNELRQTVGVILQDVFILQDTFFNNIVLDTGRSHAEVQKILEYTGMSAFTEKLPAGLETPIGEGGFELSTGQKQLLSFARVLCRDPAILVLDEATAAIDTETENILEQAISTSFEGRTSLVIAHRLSTIRRADHIIVMRNGRIIEQGCHDELMAGGGHYAKLISMDSEQGLYSEDTDDL